jgi:hypothetical protein
MKLTRTARPKSKSPRAIFWAFVIAVLGLVLMTAGILLVPWSDGQSSAAIWKSVGLGAVGFLFGLAVGGILASSAVHKHTEALPEQVGTKVSTKTALLEVRDSSALILLALSCVAIWLTWTAYDSGRVSPQQDAAAVVGQVGRFGLTLAGTFIGHHFGLKRHLRKLESVATHREQDSTQVRQDSEPSPRSGRIEPPSR